MLAGQYRDATNLNARIAIHQRFSTNPTGWTRWQFDRIVAAAGPVVLEMGCGPATLWRENLARVPRDWQITLTDFSPGMAAAAGHSLDAASDRFHLAVADAQEIPCADGSVHTVIANHMLYHVPDLARAFSEIRRVLRPGGRLFCSTIGRGHLRELSDLCRAFGLATFGESNALMAERFGLETGAALLAPWFSTITRHCYSDGLVVTDADALTAYVRSALPAGDAAAQADALAAFARYVTDRCAANGAIRITKASGMFEAVRPESE